ncbi:MAG: hypothetical protein Q8Q09_28800 [Deltaproteobacteria bacterium]|nr:hypothetical protein [Deltaproteobacteria bacterium]
MSKIMLECPSAQALRGCLGETDAGLLFVPGVHAISVGSEICVRIRIADRAAQFVIEGVVAWRRYGGHAELPAGIGVRVLDSQSHRLDHMRRWLEAGAPTEGRTNPRIPFRQSVVLYPRRHSSQSMRLLHATLEDVSLEGIRLTAPAALPHEEGWQIEFMTAKDQRFSVSLVWSRGPRAGFRIAHDGPESVRKWAEIVERAQRVWIDSATMLYAPRSPSNPPLRPNTR